MAAWDSARARQLLPPVEKAAEHTKIWWEAAVIMATGGGWWGRKAAAAGIPSMAVAKLLSNGVSKQAELHASFQDPALRETDVHLEQYGNKLASLNPHRDGERRHR
ncbi:hypothetical protein ACIF6K_28870 [Streptomyces sp. NPDC085942]|uniref:hypothetical protein n=1 Tax=Streptomyces sp. NPDC085942 TaxID=3365743 RepID=UPI0037D595F1